MDRVLEEQYYFKSDIYRRMMLYMQKVQSRYRKHREEKREKIGSVKLNERGMTDKEEQQRKKEM